MLHAPHAHHAHHAGYKYIQMSIGTPRPLLSAAHLDRRSKDLEETGRARGKLIIFNISHLLTILCTALTESHVGISSPKTPFSPRNVMSQIPIGSYRAPPSVRASSLPRASKTTPPSHLQASTLAHTSMYSFFIECMTHCFAQEPLVYRQRSALRSIATPLRLAPPPA